MRFLKEDYGESNQLDDFVNLSRTRFKIYYVVKISLNNENSERFFAYEDAARIYYGKMKEDMEKDPDYYENGSIELQKINLNEEIEQLINFNNK